MRRDLARLLIRINLGGATALQGGTHELWLVK